MARAISDEELQLRRRARRRLIGAIVLVTAIVVALPMVLDTEPRPLGGEVSIRIPPPEKYTARVVPQPPSAEPKPGPAVKPEEPDASATPKFAAALGSEPGTKQRPPLEKPVSQPPSRPPGGEAAVASQPVAPEAAAPGEFAVQVIALSDLEKVKGVRERIAAAGLESYTETVTTAKGQVTRVRVGPYPTRAAAESAREKLQSVGLSGNVVTK